MALAPKDMANTLMALYRNKEDKNKGMYRLSKDAFKTIAGKASLRDAYFWEVDAALREDGFIILDMKNEYDQIGVISMSTVIKKFQELSDGIVNDNACPSDDDDW
ncbi:hypothetical protein [Desulfuromonas thiophila]|uniref:hypothetical protein n=1 Tax=Desulfuromonas thiophila TaxID=57664 RepID=UPI0024A87AA1|nr:hypothetical protein [Desulfuromonas thiophila]